MAACGKNNTCGSQNVAASLTKENLSYSSDLLDSFWLPKSSPALQGPKAMVPNFENVGGGGGGGTPPFQSLDKEDNAIDDFDGCFNQPGKKKRLTATQVQFLEKNFEAENKLEPERKVRIAKELGLQPRQVAIWFQNRRARSKNQRIEKNYDSLKAVYDKLKVDYDNLLKEKQALQNEVLLLKDELLVKEKGNGNLETLDAIKFLEEVEPQKQIINFESETVPNIAPMVITCKMQQEEANSAKSDVFESDSPHYTDGNYSSLIDPSAADSSQDEDDNLSKGLLAPSLPPYFLKLEDCCYHDEPPVTTNSSNVGFSLEDQPFWSWP